MRAQEALCFGSCTPPCARLECSQHLPCFVIVESNIAGELLYVNRLGASTQPRDPLVGAHL
jgi:hypothetical protein